MMEIFVTVCFEKHYVHLHRINMLLLTKGSFKSSNNHADNLVQVCVIFWRMKLVKGG